MQTSVAIILPCLNAQKNLQSCLDSIINQNTENVNMEIILVDNGSTDKTLEIARKNRVKAFRELKKGPYAARNTGIKNSKSDYIAFTDSDCIVCKNWLKELISAIGNNAGVGGPIYPVDQSPIGKTAGIDQRYCLSYKLAPFLCTSNALFKRSDVESIGNFDESFIGGGDVDLGIRLALAGKKLGYNDNAEVYHSHRSTLLQVIKQYFKYGKSDAINFSRHKKSLGIEKWVDLSRFSRLGSDLTKTVRSLVQLDFDEKTSGYLLNSILTSSFLAGRIYEGARRREFIL